jgi:tetratricopeptide (TPR) repeat protein
MHLDAATGWLELGNPREAIAEILIIREELRRHPSVLEVEWAIHAAAREWLSGIEAAQELIEAAPGRVNGWLHRAYSIRRAPGFGLEKARDALLPAATHFPNEPAVAYNLACYSAQLSDLDEAWKWYQRALEIGDRDALGRMALADPDLLPLHDRIRKL